MSKTGERLRKPGILAQIDQENIDCILNAMRNDWRDQVSPGHKVNRGQDCAIDDVFGDSGWPLRKMREAEQNRGENRGDDLSEGRFSEKISEAIQQITAPDRFFAEGRENPGENNSENQELRIADEALEFVEIGRLMKKLG